MDSAVRHPRRAPTVPAPPLLLFIPGLRPKPAPELHRGALLRCLLEGVNRIDAAVASRMRTEDDVLDIVGWTYDFYGTHRDLAADREGIENLLRQDGPSERDRAEAATFKHRAVRFLYRLADRLPFLVPQVADEKLKLHLNDLRRYVTNEAGIADSTRRLVKLPLRAAWNSGRPILVIGHSMGSVIAWDTLWEMSHESREELRVDLLTLGSPLGQRHIQRRLKGCAETGKRRYPLNIRSWVNIAAHGEMTAIDMAVADDFAEMLRLGLTERIEDHAVYNHFRLNGELNVHSEYGYLVNEVTATRVCDWWLSASVRPDRDSA